MPHVTARLFQSCSNVSSFPTKSSCAPGSTSFGRAAKADEVAGGGADDDFGESEEECEEECAEE
jgi:hypothetical protein